jgi:hypothetical protein
MWKVALGSVLHQFICPYALLITTAEFTFWVVGVFHFRPYGMALS